MTIPSVNAIPSAIYIGDQSDTNSSTYKSERNPSHATRGLARQKTAFCKQNSYFLPTETNEIAGAASSAKQDRTGYHRREAKPSRQRSEITVLLRKPAAGKVGSETRALARPSPPEKHALFTAVSRGGGAGTNELELSSRIQ